MDESLIEHLKATVKSGVSREDVKNRLLAAGWPSDQVTAYVQKAFQKLEKGVLVQVRGIAKSFGDKNVFSQVDFDVMRGEIFGLIGVSGAGKTTLMNVLVGFLRPDQGDVLLSAADGSVKSAVADPQVMKANVGFSTQIPSFYPRLTVRENIEHFARLYHLSDIDASRRAKALLDLVGLSDSSDAIAAHLSGGMQKRLDIACALIHDPQLLVLDEPTADLDPILRKQLWDLIRKINAKGTTILLASHFLAEIELLCSRIGILQAGKIVELGTAQQLRDLYSKKYEVFLQTSSKKYDGLVDELKRRHLADVSIEDGELVMQTLSPEKVLLSVAQSVGRGDLESFHITRPTLGKVFESVVKR
ncbi:ABC transporter ATP-binding protein [Candidatus Woesearchaeota archaeon]|nr:ABC transporter ATP-binding protein [Candidatus Woesearchaeota archaeon]